MLGTDLGPELEYGAAGDRTFGRRDIELPKKGVIRSTGTKSGNYRPVLSLGPGYIILRRRRDSDIRRPQKPAAILTHQNWCVRPGPDEARVVPSALDHHMRKSERQRSIAAGTNLQPRVCPPRQPGVARIDDNQL